MPTLLVQPLEILELGSCINVVYSYSLFILLKPHLQLGGGVGQFTTYSKGDFLGTQGFYFL